MMAWAIAGRWAGEPRNIKAALPMAQRPANPTPPESQRCAGFGGGEARDFEATVLCYLDAAYTLAQYLTRRPDIAEDIVQDAMLRAYRSFHAYRGDNARAWLLAIVRNSFLTWKTAARKSRESDLPGDGEETLSNGLCEGAHDLNPEASLLRKEQDQAVTAVVGSLPELFREVLVLKDIEDLSYREIAEIAGVPIGTVMSRLSRARKLFATAWKERENAPLRETRS
jgi:RNA polymerase sigma factor (sigma-70 family)